MISFGHRIEMMTDRYLIDSLESLTFRHTPPADRGKVIGFEQPWEGLGSLGMTVFRDHQNIKCYYRGYPTGGDDRSPLQTSCLAVSEDGLIFVPAPVGEIEYDHMLDNNIVRKDIFCHNFAPFYDEHPDCKPEERYKAVGGLQATGGLWVFGSPDGVHWHPLADGPVITDGAFDSMNMAFRNPVTGLYHCYFRYFDRQRKSDDMPYGCRAIASCTSEDFIHWTAPVPNAYENGLTDQLYTNAARPVPGAEHMFVSIPMRFHETRKKLADYTQNAGNGISDAVLMTSRDGVHWDRSVKDAWLAGGLCDHEWTQRNFIVLGGIVPSGDEFLIYCMKNYMWDDDGIWAYAIPKYRFTGLHADGDGGRFTTKTLRFESDDIYINYTTSAYGYVKITIRDEAGNAVFASGEIYGNELSLRIHAEGIAGTVGTMTAELKEATLYALGGPM